MAGSEVDVSPAPTMLFVSLVIGATILVLAWLIRRNKEVPVVKTVKPSKQKRKEPKAPEPKQTAKPVPKVVVKERKKPEKDRFSHPDLVASLKGHSGNITSGDFSANGKHFISAADDRTVMIWKTADFIQPNHKSIRGNIPYDHLSFVRWSPDTKAFIAFKNVENAISVYKVAKTQTGMMGNVSEAFTFPKKDNLEDVIALNISLNGKFIMSCTKKTQLRIWSLKGDLLQTVDTHQVENYCAKVSACGRFIATTGFTPDVKVWEVICAKTGPFETLKRAYELVGHKASVYGCSINSDCTRVATVSRDGTWKLFDTDVKVEKEQQVCELLSVKYEGKQEGAKITLSPNGLTVVVAVQARMTFYSAVNGMQLNVIDDIYKGDILDVLIDASNTQVVTLGDRQVRVFHNVAGYTAKIQDLQASLKKVTNAGAVDRIKKQIKEANEALQEFKKKRCVNGTA